MWRRNCYFSRGGRRRRFSAKKSRRALGHQTTKDPAGGNIITNFDIFDVFKIIVATIIGVAKLANPTSPIKDDLWQNKEETGV